VWGALANLLLTILNLLTKLVFALRDPWMRWRGKQELRGAAATNAALRKARGEAAVAKIDAETERELHNAERKRAKERLARLRERYRRTTL
jgi:hypothetical protein